MYLMGYTYDTIVDEGDDEEEDIEIDKRMLKMSLEQHISKK